MLIDNNQLVVKVNWLPYTQSFEACDVKTKAIHKVEGDRVHLVSINKVIYCDQCYYNMISELQHFDNITIALDYGHK